ncbi:YeeE/YedE thiosulfate transporter family protein [Phaeocystidibacter marisrubri]|uniref:YeeE/YedE family protein n=1 Tax=Phaeocystidibacter marisrubri TaxID=1577780 RepID=A0A6L3ZE24_9FLAO|nr:YeeE/YedE thiosulfate transporter family protein [Phaeocystidibacter marisrubri]KAB2815642.1 YeeE/YedE family protein [Phaeocystidibacter marisrubri]GGH64952.1 transporter [Phaeocystidibacter marisrubri]
MKAIRYILFGIFFSIILIKSEAISWYRIFEMFHFQSVHMYGLIGSAILTAFIGLRILGLKTAPKPLQPHANILGGLSFGVGWALTGACTGPIFSLLGMYLGPAAIVLVGALVGVVIYASVKSRLPHQLSKQWTSRKTVS